MISISGKTLKRDWTFGRVVEWWKQLQVILFVCCTFEHLQVPLQVKREVLLASLASGVIKWLSWIWLRRSSWLIFSRSIPWQHLSPWYLFNYEINPTCERCLFFPSLVERVKGISIHILIPFQVIEAREGCCVSLAVQCATSKFCPLTTACKKVAAIRTKRTYIGSLKWKFKWLSEGDLSNFVALVKAMHAELTACPLQIRCASWGLFVLFFFSACAYLLILFSGFY